MKNICKLLILTCLVSIPALLSAQWELVWSDEFNGSSLNLDNWSYKTGNGCAEGICGWGNGEAQIYTTDNVSVSNGTLKIKGTYENGNIYSGRIESQDKVEYQYGKMVARIRYSKIIDAVFSAFWMLGASKGDQTYPNHGIPVGNTWPSCGEIDITEWTSRHFYENIGTIHYNPSYNNSSQSWPNNWNYITGFSGANSMNPLIWNEFGIEWDENSIKFFMNDVVYHTQEISGGDPWTEFHQPFYFILNLAFGGTLSGNNFEFHKFPVDMEVDYVRVYQHTDNGNNYTSIPSKIEAEDNDFRNGIQLESCSEGGQNVGYFDSGDYFGFNIDVPSSGTYDLIARVASMNGGSLIVEQNNGSNQLGTMAISATNGWQNWETKTIQIYLNSGKQDLTFTTNTGGLNVNWIELANSNGNGTSVKIEAEEYIMMSGIQTENCSEGGQNIGYIDAGDWAVYNANLDAGNYTVTYRVASNAGGGTIQLEKPGGGTVYGTANAPHTGAWQNWATISHNVNIGESLSSIALSFTSGAYNINWIEFSPSSSKSATVRIEQNIMQANLFPNPAINHVNYIIKNSDENLPVSIGIYDLSGKTIRKLNTLNYTGRIDISDLRKGVYIFDISNGNKTERIKVFKK